MLFVLFQLGQDRYALEARRVVEVLPLLALKRLPASPRGVAGVFVYRGQPVPALDLCELTLGRPAREQLSTRILLVQHRQTAGPSQLIGLVAERVTGTLRREEKDFVPAGHVRPEQQASPASAPYVAGMKRAATPFLGPILIDDQGVIQLLDAQGLLDAGAHQLLLTQSVEVSDAPH
ncbi:MAG: chemotaxis protein CheW [Verrucomicrobiota bacterium]|nr:chemotaxis protein CheW [Verrucomicrobiota bacterium]